MSAGLTFPLDYADLNLSSHMTKEGSNAWNSKLLVGDKIPAWTRGPAFTLTLGKAFRTLEWVRLTTCLAHREACLCVAIRLPCASPHFGCVSCWPWAGGAHLEGSRSLVYAVFLTARHLPEIKMGIPSVHLRDKVSNRLTNLMVTVETSKGTEPGVTPRAAYSWCLLWWRGCFSSFVYVVKHPRARQRIKTGSKMHWILRFLTRKSFVAVVLFLYSLFPVDESVLYEVS